MEDNNKLIVFAVVALVVGAAIGAGVGFAMWGNQSQSSDGQYNFYLYFGADNDNNGWYSASASNTNDAFDKAMKNAGFEYTKSSIGYIQSINGEDGSGSGWYLCQYVYSGYSEEAAEGSVLYPVESYGTLSYSNGWKSMSGYGSGADLKLSQFGSMTYFFSPYASDWSAASPVSTIETADWDTTGPFAK